MQQSAAILTSSKLRRMEEILQSLNNSRSIKDSTKLLEIASAIEALRQQLENDPIVAPIDSVENTSLQKDASPLQQKQQNQLKKKFATKRSVIESERTKALEVWQSEIEPVGKRQRLIERALFKWEEDAMQLLFHRHRKIEEKFHADLSLLRKEIISTSEFIAYDDLERRIRILRGTFETSIRSLHQEQSNFETLLMQRRNNFTQTKRAELLQLFDQRQLADEKLFSTMAELRKQQQEVSDEEKREMLELLDCELRERSESDQRKRKMHDEATEVKIETTIKLNQQKAESLQYVAAQSHQPAAAVNVERPGSTAVSSPEVPPRQEKLSLADASAAIAAAEKDNRDEVLHETLFKNARTFLKQMQASFIQNCHNDDELKQKIARLIMMLSSDLCELKDFELIFNVQHHSTGSIKEQRLSFAAAFLKKYSILPVSSSTGTSSAVNSKRLQPKSESFGHQSVNKQTSHQVKNASCKIEKQSLKRPSPASIITNSTTSSAATTVATVSPGTRHSSPPATDHFDRLVCSKHPSEANSPRLRDDAFDYQSLLQATNTSTIEGCYLNACSNPLYTREDSNDGTDNRFALRVAYYITKCYHSESVKPLDQGRGSEPTQQVDYEKRIGDELRFYVSKKKNFEPIQRMCTMFGIPVLTKDEYKNYDCKNGFVARFAAELVRKFPHPPQYEVPKPDLIVAWQERPNKLQRLH